VEAVLLPRRDEDHRPRRDRPVLAPGAEHGPAAQDVVHLVLGVRPLRILGARGQLVEADAQGRAAEELAVPLSRPGTHARHLEDVEALHRLAPRAGGSPQPPRALVFPLIRRRGVLP
jgi:hypothetical protein